jgi:hypothetical protein
LLWGVVPYWLWLRLHSFNLAQGGGGAAAVGGNSIGHNQGYFAWCGCGLEVLHPLLNGISYRGCGWFGMSGCSLRRE